MCVKKALGHRVISCNDLVCTGRRTVDIRDLKHGKTALFKYVGDGLRFACE